MNCTLTKTLIEEPRRICENITIPVCTTEEVVRLSNVTEDCRGKTEYCQYSFRTEEITQQTVICQRPADVVREQRTDLASYHIDTQMLQICDSECSGPSCDETYCERNSIVVCSTVHQVTQHVCPVSPLLSSDRGHHREEAEVRPPGGAPHHQDLLHLP